MKNPVQLINTFTRVLFYYGKELPEKCSIVAWKETAASAELDLQTYYSDSSQY